eukprot:scpid93242/ scgid14566/ 
MLRGVVKHCVAGRNAVQFRQCAGLLIEHRKELAPRTTEPGKPPKPVDKTPRSGTAIHKLINFPGTYDAERIVRALWACREPAYEADPIRVKFYCLIGESKDRKDKFRPVSSQSVLPYPEFGKKSSVGLFTDGPLQEEMQDDFEQIVLKDNLTKFFTDVNKGEQQLCSIYVTTSKVELFLRRFGNILRDKTPSAKKGLVADNVKDMRDVLKKACFLRRFEVNGDGHCTVDIGNPDFSAEQVVENIQHIGFRIKDLMTKDRPDDEEGRQIMEYVVLSHGRAAFCVNLESVGLNF